MRSPRHLAAIATLGLATVASTQVPAHATWLNPTTAQERVLVLQHDDRVHSFGVGNTSLLYARSQDAGRTWPVREVPVGAYTVGNSSFAATIAGAATLLALGCDQNAGPLYWRSADDGTTWSATAPLFSVTGAPTNQEVALLADGADVVAVWSRGNSGGVWCRRTVDGGATWLPPQVLDTASNAVDTLRCRRNGAVLDLFWNRNGAGVVHQRSSDGGVIWLPSPQVVTATGSLQASSSDGTNLLLLLIGSGTFLHSGNGGASWTPRAIAGVGRLLSVGQEGPLAVMVGAVTPPFVGAVTFVVTVSSDGGLTWSAAPLLLPSPVPLQTAVDVASGVVYVRFAPGNLLSIVTSRDGGATWQLVAGPASGGFAPGPRRNVHVVLEGFANTPSARYHAYVGLGSSVLGSATTGAGAITPRLVANGLPFQGSTTTLQCVDAIGGSIGAIAVSFASPSPLPFAGGTVWPTVAPLLFAFATGGTPSQPGTGGFQLPIAVPVNAALVGVSFTSQAAAVDGAAAGGIALTNALETWLR